MRHKRVLEFLDLTLRKIKPHVGYARLYTVRSKGVSDAVLAFVGDELREDVSLSATFFSFNRRCLIDSTGFTTQQVLS